MNEGWAKALVPCPPCKNSDLVLKMVGSRSLSSGARSRDPLAQPTLRSGGRYRNETVKRSLPLFPIITDTAHGFPLSAGTTLRVMRSGRDQVVQERRHGFFRDQFVAEHAGFFPCRLGRKAPQQDQQRLGGLAAGFAMRQHAFDHPAPQSCSASERVDKSGFLDDFERRPER